MAASPSRAVWLGSSRDATEPCPPLENDGDAARCGRLPGLVRRVSGRLIADARRLATVPASSPRLAGRSKYRQGPRG